jgi:hypothetical protein
MSSKEGGSQKNEGTGDEATFIVNNEEELNNDEKENNGTDGSDAYDNYTETISLHTDEVVNKNEATTIHGGNDLRSDIEKAIKHEEDEENKEKSNHIPIGETDDENDEEDPNYFAPLEVNLFQRNNSFNKVVLDTPSTIEEIIGYEDERKMTNGKLYRISKYKREINCLAKSYMRNLRILDY